MRFRVSFVASFVATTALALAGGVAAQAQSSSAQTGSGPNTTTNGTYIAVDPLAKVTYDNRWDVSLGFAYDHMKAGPTLLQGSNLGGLDLEGSYWLSKHWGIEGTARPLPRNQRRGRKPGHDQGALCRPVYFCRRP